MRPVFHFFSLNPLTREYDIQDEAVILGELGSGAQGAVYHAHYQNSSVALKKSIKKPSFFERFDQFNHSSLIKTLNIGISHDFSGQPTYVSIMEMGQDLDCKNLSVDNLRSLLLDVVEGLCYLHQNGLVHRDIKPQNIVQVYRPEKGRPAFALCDLDLVTEISTKAEITMSGTVPFLSPEAVVHSTSSFPENDVWALGATLYEIVVGKSIWKNANVLNPTHFSVYFEIGNHYGKQVDLDSRVFSDSLIYTSISYCLSPLEHRPSSATLLEFLAIQMQQESLFYDMN